MKSSISFEISSSRGWISGSWISGISTVLEVDFEVSLVPLSLVAHNAEYSLLSLEIFPTWLVMKSFSSLLFSLISFLYSSAASFLTCSLAFSNVNLDLAASRFALLSSYSPDSIFLSNSRFFSRVSWVFLVICSL